MFCRVKSNNKVFKDDIVYRFYLSKRYRENGKVKSKDIHIINLDYIDITEIRVSTLNKIITVTLEEKGLYSENNSDLIFDKLLDLREKLLKEEEQFQKNEEKRKQKEWKEWEEFNKKYGFNSDNFNNNCSGSNIGVINDTTKDFMIEIVKAGYKKLASKYHPDRGGKVEDMQKLNEAKEKLDKIVMK